MEESPLIQNRAEYIPGFILAAINQQKLEKAPTFQQRNEIKTSTLEKLKLKLAEVDMCSHEVELCMRGIWAGKGWKWESVLEDLNNNCKKDVGLQA